MTKEEKIQAIDKLTDLLAESKNVYLADISGMDAEQTSKLRRLCFSKGVQLQVVKNTLLKKAMESCLLYTSPSPRDRTRSRMPSSA